MLPDTRYFERYACAQLKDLSAEYAALCCADRPDLQDAQGRIGIEVTRAMRENRKDALAFYREISGRAETVEDPAAEGLILHAAKKKIDLLARGEYAAFDKYGLYIFSAYDLTRDALARLLGYFYLMQRNNQKKILRFIHQRSAEGVFVRPGNTNFSCAHRHTGTADPL